jgi:hypothetical protein
MAAINRTNAMRTFPLPALIAAAAALIAVPFSAAAASMLLLTAGFGFIIHVDYVLRTRRVRLPRRRPVLTTAVSLEPQAKGNERHQLAA